MKLLFVCKYNRFRSKVAESIFNRLNKNRNFKVKSAGIIKGSPINIFQKSVCKGMGIIIRGEPIGLSSSLLKWQDITVVVADDVPLSIFKENIKYGKKLISWRIRDAKSDNKEEVQKIIKAIEEKVKNVVRRLYEK